MTNSLFSLTFLRLLLSLYLSPVLYRPIDLLFLLLLSLSFLRLPLSLALVLSLAYLLIPAISSCPVPPCLPGLAFLLLTASSYTGQRQWIHPKANDALCTHHTSSLFPSSLILVSWRNSDGSRSWLRCRRARRGTDL